MQRIRRFDPVPADTAVYDAFGMLHVDADLLTSGSTSYPPIDPIGPAGRWGGYTDEETRGSGASTGLALIGDNYYDPFTGRLVARKGGPNLNAYEAEILPELAFVGTVEGAGNGLASLGVGALRMPFLLPSLVSPTFNQGLNQTLAPPSHPLSVGSSKVERGFALFASFGVEAATITSGGVGAARGAGAQLSLDLGEGLSSLSPGSTNLRRLQATHHAYRPS